MKKISVFWSDIKVYHDGKKHEPVPMVTNGELYKKTTRHIIIKNPDTFTLYDNKKHPNKKVTFYTIPKSMILDIKPYD